MSWNSIRIAQLGLGGALAGMLLVFSIRVPDAYGLPKLLVGTFFAALACGGVWAGSKSRAIKHASLDSAVLVVLGATLLCVLLSPHPLRGLVGQYGYSLYGFFQMVLFAVLYFAATQTADEESIEIVLRLFLGAGIICGLYGGLQGIGIELLLPQVSDGLSGGRAVSTLGGPVFLGSALIPFCPLGLYFLLRKETFNRLLGGAVLIAAATGIYYSVSRGAVLGGTFGAAFAWVASSQNRAKRFLRTAPIILIAAASGLLLYGILGSGARASADQDRILIWKIGARAFAARPILGAGPDSFEAVYRRHRGVQSLLTRGWRGGQFDAHNDIIQIAATMGFVGLLAYAFLLFGLFHVFSKALTTSGNVRARSMALIGALLGVFLQAKVNPVSFAAVAPLCIFAGWLSPKAASSSKKNARRWVPATAFVLVCSLFGIYALFCRADFLRQRAETARAQGDMDTALFSYRRALRLNPSFSTYFSSYGTLLEFLVEKAPKEFRRPLAVELFSLARRTRRLHPGGLRGAHLFGRACTVGSSLTDEDCRAEARRELRRARELDPFSVAVLQTSVRAALLEGDHEAEAKFKKRIAAIVGLTRVRRTPEAQGPAAKAARRFLSGS